MERSLDRGKRRGRELDVQFGIEIRRARLAAGWTQRGLAARISISHAHLSRIERGVSSCSLRLAARIASVLGLEIKLSCYPVASTPRDAGHLALLQRFRERLHPSIRWATEVPLPRPGDLRALDGRFVNSAVEGMVEAETRLADVQATERRARLKQRDAGIGRLILLVADTPWNRAVVSSIPGLTDRFPIGARRALAALSRGEDPGGDSLLML